MSNWTCPRCGNVLLQRDRPKGADGKKKKHCGCRTGKAGMPPKYWINSRSPEFKRLARIMALPGSKAAKHDAHVKAWRAQPMPKLTTQKHSAHVTAWRQANAAAAWRHAYRTDPEFNAKEKVRARLRKLKALDGDVARLFASYVKRSRWCDAWAQVLGYGLDDLVKHLKRTVPKLATWQQFIDGELHIDHILPRSSFDLTKLDDVRACWALPNLRLLPASINQRKSCKVETLL